MSSFDRFFDQEQQADVGPGSGRSRVLYVLILAAVSQLTYPITADGAILSHTIWQLIILALMIMGIRLTHRRSTTQRIMIGVTIIWGIVTVNYSFNQTAEWALVVGYIAYGSLYIMMVKVLLQFIFSARIVDRDVLYAASAAYLLIGGTFVAIYGSIEMLTFVQTGGQHAFAGAGIEAGQLLPWQDLIYFSYITLTTLGFGDIAPVTMWARSMTTAEAVIGTLYVTIIMARLVSLYVSRETVAETETQ